jgi:ribose-phosphate pyrophosphokinase
VVFAMPGSEPLGDALRAALEGELGGLEHRQFPDGETYLRITSEVAGRDVVLLFSLDHPDPKLLPLLFAADTLRELGARRIGLVAPYLPYMRQDRRFHPGEAVTSRTFGGIVSRHLDWLVTVDPHLHRYHALDEVYRIPSRVVHAAPSMATWIRENVERPVIIGPDKESEQWVARVAADAGAPFLVCEKERLGDHDVRILIPSAEALLDRQPVLVDDVASSGRTLAVAAKQLAEMGFAPPDCVVVHPLFAGDALQILTVRARRIVSTNTIVHVTNDIDMTRPVAEVVQQLLLEVGP